MKFWMEITLDSPRPKRGDILYSNSGSKRARTWIILRANPMRSKTRRYMLFRARWWELEPDMRMRLYRSAQRNGGQIVWTTYPFPKAKRKQVVNFGL